MLVVLQHVGALFTAQRTVSPDGSLVLSVYRDRLIGALGLYISNETVADFQPMNVNFGIIPPLDHRVKGKRNKNAELSQRSLAILDTMKEEVLSL